MAEIVFSYLVKVAIIMVVEAVHYTGHVVPGMVRVVVRPE